jgi:hypothetical protein
MMKLGPCSVAAGLCPSPAYRSGHPPDSPHFWSGQKGAAADVVFHNWVNEGKAPIGIVEILHSERIAFDRVISYAGSEFLCLTYKHSKTTNPMDHRCAVIENIRIAGADHRRTNWSSNPGTFFERCGSMPKRPDWRRHESELPSNSKVLRPHHLRTGRYFTLLDFCRSPHAYESGKWVTLPNQKVQVEYARMASEILDPLVEALGRVSVVRGLMPEHVARKEDDPSLWTWHVGAAAVEFLSPQDTDPAVVARTLTHPMIASVTNTSSPTGQVTRVRFQPFEPRRAWSSAGAAHGSM